MAVSSFNYNSILLRCGQGDASALTMLFNHESAVMLALAQQMLEDPAKAQQALHDVFVMVWKHADHFDPASGSARAWIYSILRYRLMRELRQTPDNIDTTRSNQLRQWLNSNYRMLHDDLEDGLAQSDPRAIDAIGLAYYKGLNASQISMLLQIPEDEVRVHLRRAMHHLEMRGDA
ncbi:MAG: sigma-70 family RNA polymerase sigma factor [Pusillimonas sp.]